MPTVKKPCSTQSSNTATVTGRPGGGHCTPTHQACLSETRATPPTFHLAPGDLRLCPYRSSWRGTWAAPPSRSSSHISPLFKRQAASLLPEGPHVLGVMRLPGGCTLGSWGAVGKARLGVPWQEQGHARGSGYGMSRHPLSPIHGSLGLCG